MVKISDEESLQEELYGLDGDKKEDRGPVRIKPKKWRIENDYEGFAFIQYVACNLNDKVIIPDS